MKANFVEAASCQYIATGIDLHGTSSIAKRWPLVAARADIAGASLTVVGGVPPGEVSEENIGLAGGVVHDEKSFALVCMQLDRRKS